MLVDYDIWGSIRQVIMYERVSPRIYVYTLDTLVNDNDVIRPQ